MNLLIVKSARAQADAPTSVEGIGGEGLPGILSDALTFDGPKMSKRRRYPSTPAEVIHVLHHLLRVHGYGTRTLQHKLVVFTMSNFIRQSDF